MVEAQDLRVGNLLYFTVSKEIAKVELIHNNHFDCRNAYGRFVPNGSYAPIPLSDEILIKAGFKEIYQSDFSVKLELEKNIDFEAVRRSGNNWQIRYKGVVIPYVIYLHQLMNLFHSLFGKELEIEL